MVNDPHSTIVPLPTHPESVAIIYIYNTTALEYGPHGLAGFNYLSLKDNIKWRGMSPQLYVPILLQCMANYIAGSRNRKQ